MHRYRFASMFLALAACAPSASPDSGSLSGGETCTALSAGTWTFSGDAFGMGDNTMTGDVTLDASACTFTFDNWDMQMDDLPSGGVLDGDAATLDGLNSRWRTCTGTATDESNAAGTCATDGTEWAMSAG